MSTLLAFDNLHNTRDLGGMRTLTGDAIKSGKLIRSGLLAPASDEDARRVTLLVDTVIDFRTEAERADKPDVELSHVDNIHIPIMEALVSGIAREEQPGEGEEGKFAKLLRSPEKARAYMCSLYESFVTNDYSVSHYAEFVRHLLRPRHKGILFHCTGGKDRAGIAAVIVETILGVSRDDVIADYLMTNECQAGELTFYMDRAKQETGISGPETDEALNWLFCAHREYIDSFYAAIDARYGSFTNFVWEGLKLTDGDVGWLRDEYLEARS